MCEVLQSVQLHCIHFLKDEITRHNFIVYSNNLDNSFLYESTHFFFVKNNSFKHRLQNELYTLVKIQNETFLVFSQFSSFLTSLLFLFVLFFLIYDFFATRFRVVTFDGQCNSVTESNRDVRWRWIELKQRRTR